MSNYVTIYEEYRHKFYQLPKVFFTNEKYISLSNNAKVAWALLRDRASLSRSNGWYDKGTGRIYFIFKNEELMSLLNINSRTTISSIKKELAAAELIEEIRIGFNKPNKMYLLYPEVTEDDIYKIDESENYSHEPIQKTAETLESQGCPKNGRPKNGLQDVQKMDSSNTDSSNTNLDLDTLDTEDTKKAPENNMLGMSEKEREQKKEYYMTKAFYENTEVVPERIAEILKVFARNPEEAKKYYNIILTAKKNAEKVTGQVIWLEHVPPELLNEIVNTFIRAIRKIEKEATVKNKEGYIYKAIFDLLVREIEASQRRIRLKESFDNKNYPYYNWLDNEG